MLLPSLELLQIKVWQHFHHKLHISGLYIPALKKIHAVGRNLPSQLPAQQQMFVFSKSPEQSHGAEMEAAIFQGFKARAGRFFHVLQPPETQEHSRDNPGCGAAADVLLLLMCCSHFSSHHKFKPGFMEQERERGRSVGDFSGSCRRGAARGPQQLRDEENIAPRALGCRPTASDARC